MITSSLLGRVTLYLLCAALSSAQTGLPSVVEKVRSEVDADAAMRRMRAIWETDRWFTFPKFHETARTLRRLLKEAELSKVEILHSPADGRSQAGFWTMPLAWDARSARLEIVEPAVGLELRVLADYRQTPASLCMWSGPTPREGITAGLVEQSSGDLSGKFVLTPRNAAGSKSRLVRQGAAGVINGFSENPDLADGRQWVNAWGDHGWAFTSTSTPLPCFSVTPRQAEMLRELLKTHGRVRLKAVVDTRYYKGAYPSVTGLVPGTGAEEVLVLGHTAEQGAHDNATGVAAMIEALATLERLIRKGKLARPVRSIRMLAMGEMYGSMDYVARHPERMRRTVAALCLDTPAGPYEAKGTEYTFYLNPHVASSYTDALILHIAKMHFASVGRPFHSGRFRSGTDTWLADPMVGVPTVWPYSGTGVNTHHNSEDKPETVDPRSLGDLTVVSAAYLYAIASASAGEAEKFAGLAAARGLDELAQAPPGEIGYRLDREIRAVRSVLRLAPIEEHITPLVESLRGAARARSARAPASAPEPSGIVVRRKRFGSLPLDDLPEDQREGFPSGAWDTRLITALYWCDGKRDLAEVIRLTESELGPSKFDWAGYFRFLARKGYVEIAAP